MVRVESLARSGFPQGPFHSRPWPRMLALMSGYVTGLRSPRWAPLAWLRDLREDLSSLPTQRGHQPPTPVGCVILSSHFLSLGLFFPRPAASRGTEERPQLELSGRVSPLASPLSSMPQSTWGSGHSRTQAASGARRG